ncbi:NnrS family protein [Fodinicurvata sediminis]|uniref:NnrS family protein n=1 Tax=Fodinicurvata sediminis TaxID=1121832 RepID=UPI0003B49CE1|nr:NnrS family protein [Fodinicurvata sediminis]
MASVTRDNSSEQTRGRWFALFAYGFRPFFLAAGVYAVVALLIWLHALAGGVWPTAFMSAIDWHAHEMIFGFAAAAMAGFILTAVPNWTGEGGFHGWRLAALALAWLAGRLALNPYMPLPLVWGAVVDLAFFPLLVLTVLPGLLRLRTRRNMIFPFLLLLFWSGNLLFHLDQLGLLQASARTGLFLAINGLLVVLALLGGRIIPAFTRNYLKSRDLSLTLESPRWLEISALAALLAMLLLDLWQVESLAAGYAALLAGLLNAARLLCWQGWRSWRASIVWILHLGFLWLPLGLLLKGLWLVWALPIASGWLHAITIGAFATMILAVMTRATLGHTGRSIVAGPMTALSYVLILVAALLRVLLPVLPPEVYQAGVILSGAAWIGAFSLFLLAYGPMLLRPRVDGKPG